MVLGTEASLAEHEVVDVSGLLTTQVLPDLDELERGLQAWDTLAGQISTVPLDELLTEEARTLVTELRLPARSAWELAGALRVRTQRVVPGINGLLTVAQMLGHRVAYLG
ncbi:MAG: hypothetical protein ACKV2O_11870 [Acidimicrobiales bacterium]